MSWFRFCTDKNAIYLYKYNFNRDTWNDICKAIIDKDGHYIKAICIGTGFGGIKYEQEKCL